MNGDDDRPVTRAELERFATKEDLDRFAAAFTGAALQQHEATRNEMRDHTERLAAAFVQQREATRAEVRDHIERVADRLSAEIARASVATGEQTRREIGALDDRYRDLPARVALLERELDEHRRDEAAHRAARPPRRRT